MTVLLPAVVYETAALKRELDEMRVDLDDMAGEVATAEAGMTDLARNDMQTGDLRAMLDDARRRHTRLDERERALRARFHAILGEMPGRTH